MSMIAENERCIFPIENKHLKNSIFKRSQEPGNFELEIAVCKFSQTFQPYLFFILLANK